MFYNYRRLRNKWRRYLLDANEILVNHNEQPMTRDEKSSVYQKPLSYKEQNGLCWMLEVVDTGHSKVFNEVVDRILEKAVLYYLNAYRHVVDLTYFDKYSKNP